MKSEHKPLRRAGRPPGGDRSDPTFAWAADPRVASWRDALSNWAIQHTNRLRAVDVGNAILARVAALGDPLPTPDTYCLRSYVSASPLHASSRKGQAGIGFSRAVHSFFEWYLDTHLTDVDAEGRPVRSREHWNPVPKLRTQAGPTQTARDALPVRLIRQLLARLTADDWAWPKTVEEDWILATDATTGETVKVWCPVRASALALKL